MVSWVLLGRGASTDSRGLRRLQRAQPVSPEPPRAAQRGCCCHHAPHVPPLHDVSVSQCSRRAVGAAWHALSRLAPRLRRRVAGRGSSVVPANTDSLTGRTLAACTVARLP